MAKPVSKTTPSYSAPALEKGIDILEHLAEVDGPRNLTEIANGLGRSKSEIFRMLAVLETRGLIERGRDTDTFVITDRLFSLRQRRADSRQLTAVALPRMEQFSRAVGQACHLALRTGDEIIVILRTEASQSVSISVAIGHRRPLARSPSGRCILAFSPEEDIETHLAALEGGMSADERGELLSDIATIRKRGYCIMQNSYVNGVTGVSAPILDLHEHRCAAALTTTILHHVSGAKENLTKIAEALSATVGDITRAMQ